MKGSNEIVLNQETMQEAVLEYLTKRMPTTPLKVESVKAKESGSGYGSSNASFTVVVVAVAEAKP
jgi:pantoate kinase